MLSSISRLTVEKFPEAKPKNFPEPEEGTPTTLSTPWSLPYPEVKVVSMPTRNGQLIILVGFYSNG